jgi:hypothetical protein
LFDEMVRAGDPVRDDGMPIANLDLRVERPGLRSVFEIRDEDTWFSQFRRQDPRLDEYEGEEKLERARKLFREERGGMAVTTRIGFDEFHAIANCLRGHEPRDGEIVVPPYEEAT